jgi:hypothetical protein
VLLAVKPAVRFASNNGTVRAALEYVPFDGFLLDGEPRWNIDEIRITDAFEST